MTNMLLKTNRSPINCPVCIKGNIESMPIAKNEGYKFDYDIKRGARDIDYDISLVDIYTVLSILVLSISFFDRHVSYIPHYDIKQ
jgi:hypothetical protein